MPAGALDCACPMSRNHVGLFRFGERHQGAWPGTRASKKLPIGITPNRPKALVPRAHVTLCDVRLPGSRWLACAAMSMAAMVVCLAVLVCSQRLEAGSQASTITPAAHPPGGSHADDGTNSLPKKVGYLVVPAEEAEAGDEHPVNAQRLTALLFVIFIGAALGMLLGGKLLVQRSGSPMQPDGRRFSPVFGRPSPQRPTAPLLSVFRL